jgi:hypothetical protein
MATIAIDTAEVLLYSDFVWVVRNIPSFAVTHQYDPLQFLVIGFFCV